MPGLNAIALALMGGAGVCALMAAFGPVEASEEFFSSWVFSVLAAGLAVGVVVSLARRVPRLRSYREVGSIIMHAGIVLLIVGAAYNRAMSRHHDMEIIEGQVVHVPGGDLLVQFNKVHPRHRIEGWFKGDAADISLLEEGQLVKRGLAYANNPLAYKGWRVHFSRFGYAPLIRIGDTSNKVDFDKFVSLPTGSDRYPIYSRDFNVPRTDLAVSAVFSPGPEGPFVRDPSMKLLVHSGDGKVVFKGRLRQGVDARAGSYRFGFGEVRHWGGISVRIDPGLDLVFAGFWCAVVGAAGAILPRVFGGHV